MLLQPGCCQGLRVDVVDLLAIRSLHRNACSYQTASEIAGDRGTASTKPITVVLVL